MKPSFRIKFYITFVLLLVTLSNVHAAAIEKLGVIVALSKTAKMLSISPDMLGQGLIVGAISGDIGLDSLAFEQLRFRLHKKYTLAAGDWVTQENVEVFVTNLGKTHTAASGDSFIVIDIADNPALLASLRESEGLKENDKETIKALLEENQLTKLIILRSGQMASFGIAYNRTTLLTMVYSAVEASVFDANSFKSVGKNSAACMQKLDIDRDFTPDEISTFGKFIKDEVDDEAFAKKWMKTLSTNKYTIKTRFDFTQALHDDLPAMDADDEDNLIAGLEKMSNLPHHRYGEFEKLDSIVKKQIIDMVVAQSECAMKKAIDGYRSGLQYEQSEDSPF